jgi:tetratricopeptide (TPR) repeat protein/S1-C subfamily serine protease
MKPTIAILLSTLLLVPTALTSSRADTPDGSIAQIADSDTPNPQAVRQTAQQITVRITANNNGGSGVLIAKKGNSYLILTNAHVTRRVSKFEIQTPDGQKHTAKPVDGGFDAKYDLALLEFTSQKQYTLADLSTTSPLDAERTIYSAGFPFDSREIRITSGQVSQLSDIPFDNGTQIGYTTTKGEKGVRQGMSGGAILDARGVLLGINTIGAAPILPNYTYSDGSKPLAKLVAKYREANWGVPVYNFLIQVKPDILYGYKFNRLEVGKIQRQATLAGYMAKLNDAARKQTVRIENSGGNGSGVIVAREGNSYYVVTAKHVFKSDKTQQKFTNNQLITYDQDTHDLTSMVVAEGVDLAVVKFSSKSNYQVAKLSGNIPNTGEIVLAGGFPGRDKINSPLWQWQLNPGYVFNREQGKFQTQTKQSFENGYDLIYSSISYGGMSGGAVFDTEGRVIGIHGKAEQTNGVMLGSSQGISIQTLIGLVSRLQLNPKLLQIAKTPTSMLTALDLKTIETAMQNLTQPDPEDDGERWLNYGNQLYRTRQLEKSVMAFDTAITKGQILSGNYGKALSLGGLGEIDLAAVGIAKAIEAVPPNERANYYYFWKILSLFLREQERYDLALKSIEIALKLEPQDRLLLNEKASVLSLKKQYVLSIEIYDKMIGTQPESYLYHNRAFAKSLLKNRQGALDDYNEAIKLNSNNNAAYSDRGTIRAELGDKQGAINDYNEAIKINPSDAKAYYNRGLEKSELGDNQGAINDYNQTLVINPDDASAYVGRGIIKSRLGDKQGAIDDYSVAIRINPNGDAAYSNRGMLRYVLGDNQRALLDFESAIKFNSNSANNYNMRGSIKSELGDKQGAMSDFNRAIMINPNDAKSYNDRGTIKSGLGDKQGAISDYNRAISINPNDVNAYYNRGNTKSKLGDKQGAISDYNRAISINPNDADAYYNRGSAKLVIGNKQEAIVDLTKAADLWRQKGRMDSYQWTMKVIAKLKGN